MINESFYIFKLYNLIYDISIVLWYTMNYNIYDYCVPKLKIHIKKIRNNLIQKNFIVINILKLYLL